MLSSIVVHRCSYIISQYINKWRARSPQTIVVMSIRFVRKQYRALSYKHATVMLRL